MTDEEQTVLDGEGQRDDFARECHKTRPEKRDLESDAGVRRWYWTLISPRRVRVEEYKHRARPAVRHHDVVFVVTHNAKELSS
jgi:hypothetical protein